MATQTVPKLDAQKRDRLGSRYAARLRNDGKLPAVVYGHGQDPLHVAVDRHAVTEVLHDNHQLVELDVEGASESCLIKDVQWDYLGDNLIHVDLTRVDLSEEVEVEVAVELSGEPAALQEEGAVLDHPVTEVTVSCRADSIPEQLVHDIESLGLDGAVTAADLVLPDGVKLVTDPETIIAQIQIVQEMSEEEEPAGEGDEPEVIGKGEDEAAEGESEGDKKDE